MDKSSQLVRLMKKKSALELMELMSVSESLAQLNKQRYQVWDKNPPLEHQKAAVFAFNGDVYEGLDAYSLNLPQLNYLQANVRILSGLYGILRPFDALQAYRLEMGTKLENSKGAHLYDFWGNSLAKQLKTEVTSHRHSVLVNLASEEYFKAVSLHKLTSTIITPIFQEWKQDRYKVISFFAKRARGLMTRYCAQHQITQPEKLKQFALEGYAYDAADSDDKNWIFRRRLA